MLGKGGHSLLKTASSKGATVRVSLQPDNLANPSMNDILHSDKLFSSEQIENETELIPLITAEDEEQMNAETTPPELPILPLRNTVLYCEAGEWAVQAALSPRSSALHPRR